MFFCVGGRGCGQQRLTEPPLNKVGNFTHCLSAFKEQKMVNQNVNRLEINNFLDILNAVSKNRPVFQNLQPTGFNPNIWRKKSIKE